MFDPAKHPELSKSPRLPAIKEVFLAIANGKPALEVRKAAVRLMHDLNAVEREFLQNGGFIDKELRARVDGK
jgi:hypothetical protein